MRKDHFMLSKPFFLRCFFIFLLAILFLPSNQANEPPSNGPGKSFSWSNETIDEFARSSLFSTKNEPRELPPPMPSNSSGQTQRFDVLYIAAHAESAPRAYLLVDQQYGKLVTKGERLRDWTVNEIGEDYVDIAHIEQKNKIERLLIGSTIAQPKMQNR